MKIGIPRGFYYHRYHPLWTTFFNHLGFEVIISGVTNEALLHFASMNLEGELCLPSKVYLAHVHDLSGKADVIFAPLIYSIARETYTCPKIIASAKIAQCLWKNLPPLISPALWFHEGDHGARMREYGRHIGFSLGREPDQIREAIEAAMKSQEEHRKIGWRHWQSMKRKKGRPIISLLAHPYILGDPVLTRRIPEMLAGEGIMVMTQDHLPLAALYDAYDREKLVKDITWNSGRELLGAMRWSMDEEAIGGIITLSYFNCGLDSFMEEILERRFRKKRVKPILSLIADEHTAQNSLWNRLDAFLDMVY